MRTLLTLVLAIIFFSKTQAQNCDFVDINAEKWIIRYCRTESPLLNGLTLKGCQVFSFPELKIKVDDDVFFNVVMIFPIANLNPYYALELSFIDDATDDKVSLYKGISYLRLKVSENNVDPPLVANSNCFYAHKGPIKFNGLPLRATNYYFLLPMSSLQNLSNAYRSDFGHQMIFDLHV